MKIKEISAIVEKTNTGFSAYAEKQNVFTAGSTFTELLANMTEALNFYFEEEGIVIKPNQVKFHIDLKQFFQHYKVLNARYLAERIGMNPTLLSQYVQGRKIPSDKQTEKILLGIQEVGRELADVNLFSR
ncbi:MAG: type II toxin-antitoxin system HicB family antitoxin [Bacteroidetes bacterium]|nr:type II toxin-antitoxin system HicB family antitoxin [Bacteroidota bacterium]